MRKTEAPHKLKIDLIVPKKKASKLPLSVHGKLELEKSQHLAALFTHVTVKLHDDDSPSFHLQQWQPRGPSFELQRWFASEFVKP